MKKKFHDIKISWNELNCLSDFNIFISKVSYTFRQHSWRKFKKHNILWLSTFIEALTFLKINVTCFILTLVILYLTSFYLRLQFTTVRESFITEISSNIFNISWCLTIKEVKKSHMKKSEYLNGREQFQFFFFLFSKIYCQL